jgi:hypothetical protein
MRVLVADIDVVDLTLEIPHPTFAGDLEARPLGVDDLEPVGSLLCRPREEQVAALAFGQEGVHARLCPATTGL